MKAGLKQENRNPRLGFGFLTFWSGGIEMAMIGKDLETLEAKEW